MQICQSCSPKSILNLSDRAKFFATDTLEVAPEVESGVFNLDPSIGIYRVLKNKTLSWPNTFTYCFIEKEESEIFEKAQNYLWHVIRGSCKTIFSPIGQDLIGFFLGRMENQILKIKQCVRIKTKKKFNFYVVHGWKECSFGRKKFVMVSVFFALSSEIK